MARVRNRHPFHHPRECEWPVEVVEEWWCPICGAAAHRELRPGRPKVYCSNACRQRAYRRRRAACARSRATPSHPAERARVSFGKVHALRTERDPLSDLSDRRRREITVCGVFAHPARHGKWWHYNLYPGHPRRNEVCVSCVSITQTPDLATGSTSGWRPRHPPDLAAVTLQRNRQILAKLLGPHYHRLPDWRRALRPISD